VKFLQLSALRSLTDKTYVMC